MDFCRQCVAFAGLTGLLLTSCSKSEPAGRGETDPVAPRVVRVVRPEMRPLERALQVVGTLAAYEETLVAAQVAGQIETSHVDLGDRVAARQEMALIDTTSYEALARQSAAALARATATAENAARNLTRIQNLKESSIASISELDLAVAEDAQARAEVKAAEAADAIARLNLERSHVRAPFEGAVAERLASVGAFVTVGAPIVRLVKTDPLRLRLLALSGNRRK
jgi:RND family efflux transporter MFP subunit